MCAAAAGQVWFGGFDDDDAMVDTALKSGVFHPEWKKKKEMEGENKRGERGSFVPPIDVARSQGL